MATIKPYQTGAGATLYMVRYRKPDGGQTMKRGFATKRAATLFAATVEVSKAKGEYIAPTLGRVTVGGLAANWLGRKEKATAPSHYRMLESAWRVHVKPYWGDTAVADVDLLAVEEWITELTTNSGATTVLRAYGVLSGILADAVKGKRLAANPCKGVENLPRKTARRHVYLSADDVHRLADAAGDHRALVLTLAYCGIRWGEAIALRVRDVEFLRRRLSVSENAVQATRRGSRGGSDQGAQGPLGAGASVRSGRAVKAVPGQRSRRSGLRHRREVPAAPQVHRRLVRVGGEAGQGAEDHAARPAPHMCIAVSVGRGERVGAATHARAHVGEDDSGHVLGSVR